MSLTQFQSKAAAPARGVAVRAPWQRSLLTFLMVVGPGLIVTTADNDAGAVSTYTQAGALYGTHLLWLLVLLLPTTYFVQEMVARLGIATGQGHAAMIYRRFGKWWGVFSLCDLLLVNFLTLVTEFAGINLAARQMGLSPQAAVPGAALALVLLVSTGSYRRWERMTIALCLLNVAWFALAGACHPSGPVVARHLLTPGLPPGGLTSGLVFLVIGIVGTTIAPWQLFFQQSCVADKRLRFSDLKWARLDTFLGAVLTVAVAGCMMLVGDLAFRRHIPFADPAQMAVALGRPLGPWFHTVFLLLMADAAILGATAISLSSSWAYGEVRGWTHSLERKITDAPGFYGVYVLCVAAAAALVLVPRAPLQLIIVGVQVLAGVMLPSAVIFLQLLLNDRELLGERFANRPWNNVVNWTIIVVLFVLSLVLAAQVIFPNLFPAS
ncbi:MAG: Nramp family divalent metal transporter [Armatimonadetes bacterium]|nr:Nramp family divalent metal transporter [Armatimonadota bacterium]